MLDFPKFVPNLGHWHFEVTKKNKRTRSHVFIINERVVSI